MLYSLHSLAVRTAAVSFAVILTATPVFAQGFNSEDTGLDTAAGSAGYDISLQCVDQPGGCIPQLIGRFVNGLLGIFGALFLVLIMYGGFQYMTAGGDEGQIKKARQTIQNAILGMIIVAASFAIATFVLQALEGSTTGSGGASTVQGA